MVIGQQKVAPVFYLPVVPQKRPINYYKDLRRLKWKGYTLDLQKVLRNMAINFIILLE